jgi:catechol-2,3-dioxygenase
VSDQQIQKVKVKRLAHVGLWATDVVAQANFYRQVMGFDVHTVVAKQNVSLDEANVFLSLGDAQHSLAIFSDTQANPSNGHKPSSRSQLHHLSFEVDTDAELAALAARLNMANVEVTLATRDGDPELGDTLWFNDPDGNRLEIVAPPDMMSARLLAAGGQRVCFRPYALQHVALETENLEAMVAFYTETLGFDISDWLLRECVWLRCNSNHRTLILMQGKQGVDHVGYTISDGPELLRWADHLSIQQTPILWGPGRHGTGNDLFLRFADAEGIHIELSAELQQYYDRDVTTPPRLWHTRSSAYNLWAALPNWMREEILI